MPSVRPLAEADLPQTWRIARTAFGTFLGAPDPENFWRDRDLHRNRFRSDNVEAFVADEGGAVVGSNFVTRWGSVGFFGPLTTRVDRWDGGLAQPLVAAACDAFDRWGVSHAGLFTFPHSAKHVHLYGKFGFYPRFLTAIMSGAAAAYGLPADATRYSAAAAGARAAAEAAAGALCDEIYPGLDLGGDIRAVAAQGLGDTLLLWEGSRLAGFAVCHWGPDSEAGAGFLYVKFGAVRGGAGAAERFARLLDAAAALAHEAGQPAMLAGVNLAREEAYRQMKARGFRTEIQGVTMHRDNAPGYSRPGVYVLDDWR
ncbi:MAG: GNAT family N-acetyltransferase [Alphaproteobacteria bacterium]|nr:GNAT family N-acetyltransferase [Alphaproteobacteria bacterium]